MSSSDFLTDPLYVEGQFKKFARLEEWEQNNWEVFHTTIRSKLEAAVYFYALIIGMAKLQHVELSKFNPYALLNWYLDVFFYELVSAFDILLQEVNVVYQCGLEVDEVSWGGMNDKRGIRELLSEKDAELSALIAGKYGSETFIDIRRWRNIAAHQHHIPKASTTASVGEFVPEETTVELFRVPYKRGTSLEVSKLREYIKFMESLASEIWQQFPKEAAGGK